LLSHTCLSSWGMKMPHYCLLASVYLTHSLFEALTVLNGTLPFAVDIAVVVCIVPMAVFVLTVECTHLDRTLLKAVLSCFEFWYLISQILVQTTVGLVTLSSDFDVLMWSQHLVVGCFLNLYSCMLDAVILLPHRIKVALLLWRTLHIVGTYALIHYGRAGSVDHDFCAIGVCTNTRALRAACLLQILVFTCKYLVHMLRQPSRFVILGQAMRFETYNVRDSETEPSQQIGTRTQS
jgi:hypothetical protein